MVGLACKQSSLRLLSTRGTAYLCKGGLRHAFRGLVQRCARTSVQEAPQVEHRVVPLALRQAEQATATAGYGWVWLQLVAGAEVTCSAHAPIGPRTRAV